MVYFIETKTYSNLKTYYQEKKKNKAKISEFLLQVLRPQPHPTNRDTVIFHIQQVNFMSHSKLQTLYAKKLHLEAKPSIDTHTPNKP